MKAYLLILLLIPVFIPNAMAGSLGGECYQTYYNDNGSCHFSVNLDNNQTLWWINMNPNLDMIFSTTISLDSNSTTSINYLIELDTRHELLSSSAETQYLRTNLSMMYDDDEIALYGGSLQAGESVIDSWLQPYDGGEIGFTLAIIISIPEDAAVSGTISYQITDEGTRDPLLIGFIILASFPFLIIVVPIVLIVFVIILIIIIRKLFFKPKPRYGQM
ncbi:MAG: hypothetical protein INQ03_08170 [Candidatus Heimdallarchaeota archaeon]|nr:hypothetical protein [Candidatus Heimdallarchaeota archaeon]